MRSERSTTDVRRVKVYGDAIVRQGPVFYWMSRDQRVRDNWALLHAAESAARVEAPLGVVFCLVPEFLGATVRHYGFMLKGLQEVERDLHKLGIPFLLTPGQPERVIPGLIEKHQASAVVTDFSPLRINRRWIDQVRSRIRVPLHEVDAHNVVPCWQVSDKQEYAAYTIRPKIRKLVPEYLTEFPKLGKPSVKWASWPPGVDWRAAWRSLNADSAVPEVTWLTAGQKAATKVLDRFLTTRLADYHEKRNDPHEDRQSGLSPYLHFGQIAAQRVALELQRYDENLRSQEAFAEELIVRRELADNFCHYNPGYDSYAAFPAWARRTLEEHRRDPREYLYGMEQLEEGKTHDDLWNAAQHEMVFRGKMHGYLRMYWAKKILEWSVSAEEALAMAVYLNDKYELDGRDPNGYAGMAWSIGGLHDRPWGERPIFGKIRYMSYAGCRRKFDVDKYVVRVTKMRAEASL